MKNIGNAMRAQRLLSNKTLLQVEKDTGISNASISRWETGKVIPNVEDCNTTNGFSQVFISQS